MLASLQSFPESVSLLLSALCLCVLQGSVSVANALATLREAAKYMARHVSATIAAAKTWTAWSVEVSNSHSPLFPTCSLLHLPFLSYFSCFKKKFC